MATNTAQALANWSRALDPVQLDSSLAKLSLDELGVVYREAVDLGQRAWMALACCVGRAQEAAGYGDAALEQLAEHFGAHRGTIGRLGKIYRDLLLPRIAAGQSDFVLAEKDYYLVAAEAAGALGRSPVALLEQAEEAKLRDPSYSARRFREELDVGDEGSTVSEMPKLRRLIKRLASVEDSAIDELINVAGRGDYELIADAFVAIERALVGVKARFASAVYSSERL